MDSKMVKMIIGEEQPSNETEKKYIEFIKKHLSYDNNKLREDFVCSLLGYEPSYGGAGFADGYKPDGTPVDNKSGHNIIFPDGANKNLPVNEWAISKKLNWDCLVQKFTDDGELIYVAEVPVSCIIEELISDANKKIKKGGRVSPAVSSKIWRSKKQTKILYKNSDLFEKTKNGKVQKVYNDIDNLPYTPVKF